MHRLGLLDHATHDKITMRHRRPEDLPGIGPVTGAQIRLMRARAKMSQAVFASHLNVTTDYVSQLERGAKRPTGAALASRQQ
jgi:putative transcriptional regulator